jgi:hypothetical protein
VVGAQIDASGERTLATYRSGRTIIHSWDGFNAGESGYRLRETTGDDGREPERFDTASIAQSIEANINDLARAWYADKNIIDAALRFVIGSTDDRGRAVYVIHADGDYPNVRFTSDGRTWVTQRVRGDHGGSPTSYGRKIRRSLYGEFSSSQDRSSMVRSL